MKRDRQHAERQRRSARERLQACQLDEAELASVTGGFERRCECPPRPLPVAG